MAARRSCRLQLATSRKPVWVDVQGVVVSLVFVVVPMGIFPMANSCRIPLGKPAATVSRHPTIIIY